MGFFLSKMAIILYYRHFLFDVNPVVGRGNPLLARRHYLVQRRYMGVGWSRLLPPQWQLAQQLSLVLPGGRVHSAQAA